MQQWFRNSALNLVKCCHFCQSCDCRCGCWQINECGAFSARLQTWLEAGNQAQGRHRLSWLRQAHIVEPGKTGLHSLHLCIQPKTWLTNCHLDQGGAYCLSRSRDLLEPIKRHNIISDKWRQALAVISKLGEIQWKHTCKRWCAEAFHQLLAGKRWGVPCRRTQKHS